MTFTVDNNIKKEQNDLKIQEVRLNKDNKSALNKICNINQDIKGLVYNEEKLKSDQIKIINIAKDGNCF